MTYTVSPSEESLLKELYQGTWKLQMHDATPVALIHMRTNDHDTSRVPVYQRLHKAGYVEHQEWPGYQQAWPECTQKAYAFLAHKTPKTINGANPYMAHKLQFAVDAWTSQQSAASNPDAMRGMIQGLQMAHTMAMQRLQHEMQQQYDALTATTSLSSPGSP